MEIIFDHPTDFLLRQNHRTSYMTVQQDRMARKTNALSNFLSSNFPHSPLPSLSDLQKNIEVWQRTLAENTTLSEQEIQNINYIINDWQEKITNNQYYIENSPEHQYSIDYKNAVKSFVWPNEEELIIRENEKSQLLELLNNG